ncbi:MAG TPA: hypothetical protein VKR06_29115 [Ktedonosporobacter sp.]|nr:hypothetical protein [Ktedonosporobacter sp.]
MLSPDNPLKTYMAADFQPASGEQAFRLESLDSALLASMLEASLDGFLLFNSDLRCFSASRWLAARHHNFASSAIMACRPALPL